jgi:hypothetical protein
MLEKFGRSSNKMESNFKSSTHTPFDSESGAKSKRFDRGKHKSVITLWRPAKSYA